ncbi:rRNA maturation RNase YbeY [Candidatus Dependentiae bacterium]
MVTIKTTQRNIKFNVEKLKSSARSALALLDYHDFALNILLTTNNSIQAYNKKFRNIDKPTDILSFPFYPDLKPGERIIPEVEDDRQLGDIIISLEYVREQLKELKTTMDEQLLVLLVHGICHLIGYDHETDDEFKQMQERELWLLEHLR